MFPQIKEESEIGGFEIIKEINRGSFSSVYKCRNKSNCTKGLEEKKLYALKIFTVEDEYKYIPDAVKKSLEHVTEKIEEGGEPGIKLLCIEFSTALPRVRALMSSTLGFHC